MKNARLGRRTRNTFQHLGLLGADTEQIKSFLAAQIIKVVDERQLTVRSAAEATGTAAADFSRIRQARLDRFTVDRLIGILNRLDQGIEVAVNVRPRTLRTKLTPG